MSDGAIEKLPRSWIREKLSQSPTVYVVLYGIAMSFGTYFCMYAFRKPFSVGTFEGPKFWRLDLKTTFVVSQILGYALSKFIGIKICTEIGRRQRRNALWVLIVAAQCALLLFAVLPESWKIAAIFLNGLPLGMVWGLCVWYLEGRRTSELLLAGLSCSFIISSALVKDVGRYLLVHQGIPEFWMPFCVGSIFIVPYFLFVWLLDQLPDPDEQDEAERSPRVTMDREMRYVAFKDIAFAMVMLLVGYFFLTAFRDYRDNYGIEIFQALGYAEVPLVFSRTDWPIAFGVMSILALTNFVRNRRWGLFAAFAVMLSGALMIGAATWLFDGGHLTGITWMVLIGLGAYVMYVPYGSLLFDRLMAATGMVGTAVFGIYIADAIGYTGSIGVQLYKDLGQPSLSRLQFFRWYCYFVSATGILTLVSSYLFLRKKQRLSETLTESRTARSLGSKL